MKVAALKIENCWCRHRDRQMFQLMKYAVCSADNCLTHEIMRKINPVEAELLNDPVFKAKIRFRFTGVEFPPYIVFKVFIKTNGVGLKYLSGKKNIKPASKAAKDSCHLMGNRKFFDQMISDLCEEKSSSIRDELDISCLQDYMKYISKIDETPAKAGGKDNLWRKLSLESVPQKHIIFDVLTYLQDGTKTEKLGKYLLKGPSSQSQQVELITLLSKNKSPPKTSRRSKQAVARVNKMRNLYKEAITKQESESDIAPRMSPEFDDEDDEIAPSVVLTEIDFDDESWDSEGQLLFEWTKNLSPELVS